MLTRSPRPTALAVGLVMLVLSPAAAQAAGRGRDVVEAPPAAPASGQPVPGEVLVGFESNATGSERSAARRSADVTVKRALGVPGVQLVKTAPGESVAATIAQLERDPNVRYAEPNRWRTVSATTNDPLLSQLWGLDRIDAPEAWDVSTGGDPVIAVVDQGVNYLHPDLAPNMWRNPGEIPGNGQDEDNNGFVDDVFGADTVNNDGDPMDLGGHGTHVAGTIAAAGNNGLGITGVAQKAQLMAVQGLGANGSGTDAQIADAFEYAASMGARVVNASLGGAGGGDTMRAPIQAHPETLFIVAAGNDGGDNDSLVGPDTFPCKYPDANLICVGATNPDDSLASYSNTGTTSVDLAAPGTIVLSTGLGRTRLSDGFEGNDLATRWTPSASPVAASWGLTAPGGTSGHSVSDSPVGRYAAATDTYLDLATPLNFSGASGCVLNFIAKTDLGSGDVFAVDRSVNGGAFQRRLSVTSSTGSYRSFNVNLGADGQSSVRFGFGLESDGGTSPSSLGDGVNVDDVTVNCTSSPSGDPAYRFLDGTSMATPHVTGAAALLLGRKPTLTVAQLRSALLHTGDSLPGLAGKTVTGKRLNVNNAIRTPAVVVPPTARTSAASGITTSGAVLNGTVNPRSTATSSLFEYGTTTAYGASTAAADAGAGGTDQAASAPIRGLQPSTTYHYRLVALRGGERFPGADATFTTAAASVERPPVIVEPTLTLGRRVRAARVACARKRGKYRCRVSLTRASGMNVKLVLKRGTKVLGRGSGRVGKLIKLQGKKAKAGRYTVKLTFTEGAKKASLTKRIRVR